MHNAPQDNIPYTPGPSSSSIQPAIFAGLYLNLWLLDKQGPPEGSKSKHQAVIQFTFDESLDGFGESGRTT